VKSRPILSWTIKFVDETDRRALTSNAMRMKFDTETDWMLKSVTNFQKMKSIEGSWKYTNTHGDYSYFLSLSFFSSPTRPFCWTVYLLWRFNSSGWVGFEAKFRPKCRGRDPETRKTGKLEQELCWTHPGLHFGTFIGFDAIFIRINLLPLSFRKETNSARAICRPVRSWAD